MGFEGFELRMVRSYNREFRISDITNENSRKDVYEKLVNKILSDWNINVNSLKRNW
jgi:hypothetical protein